MNRKLTIITWLIYWLAKPFDVNISKTTPISSVHQRYSVRKKNEIFIYSCKFFISNSWLSMKGVPQTPCGQTVLKVECRLLLPIRHVPSLHRAILFLFPGWTRASWAHGEKLQLVCYLLSSESMLFSGNFLSL